MHSQNKATAAVKKYRRFWGKVDKTGSCWVWTASKNRCGYGQFRVDGNTVLAHRYVLEVIGTHIPPSMCVCHSCDNPACVNPDHLFLSDHVGNMHDMARKGRAPRGEDHHASKLTEDNVLSIRSYSGPLSYLEGKFGVSNGTISQVRNRKRWTHV